MFCHIYTCACTGILGEITVFANSTREDTTMGARGGGGGGKSRRSIAPPLKIKKILFPLYGEIFASFSMWGLFCYVFLIIVLRSQEGGNHRQLPPLKKSAIWGAFLLPFLYVRAFLLRFSHYNYAPAEREGARLGVRPSLKNEEKICFAI